MTLRKHLELKDIGEKGEVSALIATYDVIDKDGDVTFPGFFGEQSATIVTAHNWGDIMLGKGTIKDTPSGAIFDGRFNLEDPDAAKLHSKLRFDLETPPPLIEWSYAFDIKEGGAEKADRDGTPVRNLQPLPDGSPGAKVFEVSPVLLGAGEGTGTLSIKNHHKFQDQAADVMTQVQALVDRADEIKQLRLKRDGNRKPLGAEVVTLLTQLGEQLKTLEAVLTVPDFDGSFRKEWLTYQRTLSDLRRIS